MPDPYKRDRRLGRWFISGREQAQYPGILQHIQDTVLILRAYPAMMRDCLEFMGRGEQFDIVEEGEIVPEYVPRIVDERVEWTRATPVIDWQPGLPIMLKQPSD
jgi:hypothetical protein